MKQWCTKLTSKPVKIKLITLKSWIESFSKHSHPHSNFPVTPNIITVHFTSLTVNFHRIKYFELKESNYKSYLTVEEWFNFLVNFFYFYNSVHTQTIRQIRSKQIILTVDAHADNYSLIHKRTLLKKILLIIDVMNNEWFSCVSFKVE